MSPEAFGKGAVDHRTDIWSVGVTFYYLLTCKLSFDKPSEMAADGEDDEESRLRAELESMSLPELHRRARDPHALLIEQDILEAALHRQENAYLLRHFILKTTILPRQARDKHRESSEKRCVFLQRQPQGLSCSAPRGAAAG